MGCEAQLANYVSFWVFFEGEGGIFTSKLTWLLLCDQGSLVCLCMQDYKCLCAAVTICSTLVNIHTHIHTAFDQLI